MRRHSAARGSIEIGRNGKRKTENGKRKTENGKRKTERRTQNAERRTQNAERRTQNAERRTQKNKNPAREPGFCFGDPRIGHLRVDIAEFGCGGRI
ncbi:hypothetical protein E4F34_14015 [Burkholderia pseudomallei]|nr:hypothetical protein E4F34_14015 [Burkholderia pseudomallei]